MVASGIRIGTPAVTTRGMREAGDGSDRRATSRACSPRPKTTAALQRMVKSRSRSSCAGSSPCIPNGRPETRSTTAFADDGPLAQRDRSVRAARAGSAAWRAQVAERARATAACCSPKPAPAPARRMALSGARDPQRPARAGLHRHEEPAGADLLQGPARARARRCRVDVQGDLHEGPRATTCACIDSIRARAQHAPGGLARRRSPRGRRRPRPAIAPSSTICRMTAAIWSDIAATAETCLGSECPQYQQCFVTRMRQRAAESDMVIVNHHLLCADAAVRQSSYGEVIPECTHLVLDEAHQLEDVATQYFGMSVSNYRLDELVRDGERLAQRRRDRRRRRRPARVRSHASPITRARSSAPSRWRGALRGRFGEERLRIGPRTGSATSSTTAWRSAPRSTASRRRWRWPAATRTSRRHETPARTRTTIARRAGEVATTCGSCSPPSDAALRLLPRDARARRVSAGGADRRRRDRSGTPARSDAHDRAHLGDARRRRVVRLRAPAARHRGRRSSCACRRSSISRGRACCICRGACRRPSRRTSPTRWPPKSRRSCGAPQGRAFVLFTSYAMMHAVLRIDLLGSRPYPLLRSGHRPAQRAAEAVPGDAELPCCWPPPRSGRAWTSSAIS